MNLASQIEGLLFYKGEEISIDTLASLLSVTKAEVEEALTALTTTYEGRGLVLVRNGDRVVLGIASGLSSLIESIRKEEITKDLSKAALETLSIILYKDGVSRPEIDYIRGVNSSFILRNLLVRGLVEKVLDRNDSRRVLYVPTIDTLAYMGVSHKENLPNYEMVRRQLEETLHQNQSHD